jgi:acetyl esterase
MPLDPQMKVILRTLNATTSLDFSSVEPAVVRQIFVQQGEARVEGEPVAEVAERTIPGPAGDLTVRIYTPFGNGPLPVLMYFHGGGFVLCNLDSHDGICRLLTNAAHCTVVSVDYRLAPEAKFPSGPEDCFAATRWVAENATEIGADPGRVAIAGDSAGGALAAAVALMARDRGGPELVHQLLVCPITNHAFDTASYMENASGYQLTREMMQWFWRHYLETEADGRNPLASPLRAPDVSRLPPATVITAEFDPLRDEGEAYAARLDASGVPTQLVRYDGMIHDFVLLGDAVDRAKEAVALVGRALRDAFRNGL